MSAVSLHMVETEVLLCVAAAQRVCCFLDYDGTLAPLAPTPDAARPWPDTAMLLQQLAAAPGMLVAIVSGRTVADLRRFLDVSGILYIGIHGLETRFPDGTMKIWDGTAAARAVLSAIKQPLLQALGPRVGVFVEDKELALACHYRLASRDDAAAARRIVAGVAESLQQRGVDIAVRQGHEVSELLPASASKSAATRRLLTAGDTSALAIYIGDDQADEDVFTTLPPTAITIRVGSAATDSAARYRLAGPQEVQAFLRAVCACRARRMPPGGRWSTEDSNA